MPGVPVSRIVIVCPSVTAGYAERFCGAAHEAIACGAALRPVLVANDAGTHALADRWPEFVVKGPNAGFAASINQGAALAPDFDWLVVANDDMDYDADTFVRLARYLAAEPADGQRLIRLTGELPWRRIPGFGGVFTGLSLLEKVTYRFGRRMRTAQVAPADPDLYPPFTLVAISAPTWRAAAGMEEALPFCYEDAWFVRRARASTGGVTLGTYDLGVHHLQSVTTGSRIDVVLPVISWSALVYLQLIGVPPLLARATCLLALVVRLPLSLAGRANRRQHLRGIWRAVRAVAAGRPQSLPAPGRGWG